MCRYLSAVVFLGFLLLAVSAASADVIRLNTGGSVEGRIIERTDFGIKVKTLKGEIFIRIDDIDSVEIKETIFDEYDKRSLKLKDDDAPGHYELGLWCKEKGLKDEAQEEFEKVIAIDPNHENARKELGFEKTEEGWILKKEEPATATQKQPEQPSARKPEPQTPPEKKPEPQTAEKPKVKKDTSKYPDKKPGTYDETYTTGRAQERVIIYVPGKYTKEEEIPLMLLLHGAGDTAQNFMNCIKGLTNCEDMIMVALENSNTNKNTVTEIIKILLKEYNIDKKRIYIFGFSMGGWATSRIAPPLPDVFAAFCIAGAGLSGGVPPADRNSPAAGILIGKSDPNYRPSVQAKAVLERQGYDTKFWEFDGGHVLPGPELMKEVWNWFRSKHKK